MHTQFLLTSHAPYKGRSGTSLLERGLWPDSSLPCTAVIFTNVFLVLIGQPSPENDNTIKDLLPEDAGIDHQTVHQLITVLMKFMAKDESSAESDISSAKAFNTVKRHLYVLLGYDQQEGCFMIAPQKMRISTCFNAFIAGIAQVSLFILSGQRWSKDLAPEYLTQPATIVWGSWNVCKAVSFTVQKMLVECSVNKRNIFRYMLSL